MLDHNAEALGFPNKFPLGKGSFTNSRSVPITLKKYSNQRVLNCDKIFSHDKLFVYTQFLTEQNEIRDNISVAFRKLSGSVTEKRIFIF